MNKHYGVFFIFLFAINLYGAPQKISLKTPSAGAVKPKQKPFKGIHDSKETKNIIWGTSVPLSGSLYKLGQDYSKSMGIVFNKINQEKVLNSYFLKPIVLDDQYEYAEIKKNISELLKQTSILFGTFSSDVLYALPKSSLDDLLVVFPNAGASQFRSSVYSSFFFFRPSTAQEIDALISYAVNELGSRKIAVFYEDSFWGNDGAKQAKKIIKGIGKETVACVATAAYTRNTVDIKEATKIISKKSPDTILCISHYRATYNFIRAMLNTGKQINYLGVSETSLIQEYLKKSRGVTFVTSSVVPNPWKSKLPIVQEYRDAMRRYLPNYKLSLISLEGYINASIWAHCLKQITPPITKNKIITSLQKLKSYKGLSLDFNNATRTFSNAIWLNKAREKDWPIFKKSNK